MVGACAVLSPPLPGLTGTAACGKSAVGYLRRSCSGPALLPIASTGQQGAADKARRSTPRAAAKSADSVLRGRQTQRVPGHVASRLRHRVGTQEKASAKAVGVPALAADLVDMS